MFIKKLQMLAQKITEPSTSEWAAPHSVGQKEGWQPAAMCWLLDTEQCLIDRCLPHADNWWHDWSAGETFIITLDLTWVYWLVPVANNNWHKTAFITPFGSIRRCHLGCRMPQRMMDRLIQGLQGFASAYLDDLVIYSDSWEDHLQHLW